MGASWVGARSEPPVVLLWEGGAPGFQERRNEPELAQDYWIRNIHNPSLTVFLPAPEKATGTAVVICPGGGHRELVFNAEGVEPAKFFNELGVAAFVLKYRLAKEPGSNYSVKDHAQADLHRAMRLVRSRASEWGVNPNRIGVMGWSAGAELAAMVTYTPGSGDANAQDPVRRVSSRPDFQIIIYPGDLGIPFKVNADAPPAFFLAANDDPRPAANVLLLLEKYRAAGASAEVHLYAKGGHGFNMGNRSDLVSIRHWPQRLADWMRDRGYLRTPPRPAAPAAEEAVSREG